MCQCSMRMERTFKDVLSRGQLYTKESEVERIL
jgi:hypothetical protein